MTKIFKIVKAVSNESAPYNAQWESAVSRVARDPRSINANTLFTPAMFTKSVYTRVKNEHKASADKQAKLAFLLKLNPELAPKEKKAKKQAKVTTVAPLVPATVADPFENLDF